MSRDLVMLKARRACVSVMRGDQNGHTQSFLLNSSFRRRCYGNRLKGYYVEVGHWDGKAASWCGAWGADRQRAMRWKWSLVGMSSFPIKVWELILSADLPAG